MQRLLASLLPALLFVSTCPAQTPDQLLNNWSARSPIEKLYLHLDRDSYIAGETAWFKAYTYSDYGPDTISTSIYVELTDNKGSLVSRSILPVVLGTASGYVELSDSLFTGTYQLRAYSPTMLNQDPAFIYRHPVFIYGKKNPGLFPEREKLLRLEFFPEGGNLVNGFMNTVAFKATDEYGMPVNLEGKLFNDKNKLISAVSSLHDGMGMFELTPVSGEKYFIQPTGNLPANKYYLPESVSGGIALNLIPHPQGYFFEIRQRKEDPVFRAAYMIGQMQHRTVFRQEFKTVKEEIQGVIDTRNLHSGILQVTFFNKDDQPLAERLCFVNNKEYLLQGELLTDTLDFGIKSKNRFSIRLKDTIQGSFSVSVSDADYWQSPTREENILSRLLLSGDLKGTIHNPAYYFTGDDETVKTALDLLMMTHGWRRFSWKELAQRSAVPLTHKDGSYITLSGKVNLRDSKKAFAEKPLLMMLITADSTRRIQMTSTDKLGRFRLDSMLFFGRSRILFSDTRGKKSQYIDVQFDEDSLTRTFLLPEAGFAWSRNLSAPGAGRLDLDKEFTAIRQAAGLMLEGITVKAKKRTLLQELDEKYAKGAFSGDANKVIDLVSNDEAKTYNNIFDYLQFRVPGLQISTNGFDYEVFYRQLPTISSLGNIPMIIYLDEIETDASFVSTIPANQVAMVKVFSSFVAASGNAPGGVLAIYTKKGADLNDVMQHAADMKRYNGYTITREFYHPDYTVDKGAREQADNRITLDWRPNLLINNVNPRIPLTFYNNDRSKSFKVVVEGMTRDGRMLMLEKIITKQ